MRKSVCYPHNPIMIVDDEPSILLAIDTTMQMAGMSNTITCQDSREVMRILTDMPIDAMLLDLNMPKVDGHQLLDEVRREYPDIPVIIITGAMDVDTAVRCIKAGAFDYIVKPLEPDRLMTAVNRAVSFQELKRENEALRRNLFQEGPTDSEVFRNIITGDAKMLAIFKYVAAIAMTPHPVLIQGETGVGKELIARAIHRLSGLKGKFVAVNAAGLDDNVFADTLFGHLKGAFTGAERARGGLVEQADGGTLFLDEIGDLSPASQVKLLRLLQEGEYFALGSDETQRADIRVIAATNQQLSALLDTGRFRKDLNYRLQTHRIDIPPLRERSDDIPQLLDYFLERAAFQQNKPKPTVDEKLVVALTRYAFPGNIRELESMVFDALSRHHSGTLSPDSFLAHIENSGLCSGEPLFPLGDTAPAGPRVIFPGPLPTLKEAGRLLVEEAIRRCEGNQSKAAAMLGITQQALSKRLLRLKRND